MKYLLIPLRVIGFCIVFVSLYLTAFNVFFCIGFPYYFGHLFMWEWPMSLKAWFRFCFIDMEWLPA